MYGVKVKFPDMGRFAFVTPRGGLIHLRVHAAQFERKRAERVAQEIRDSNPTAQVRIQALYRKGV